MASSPVHRLAKRIAVREGKKSQARIGDIMEILKIYFTLDAEEMVRGEIGPETVHGICESETGKMVRKLIKKLPKAKG